MRIIRSLVRLGIAIGLAVAALWVASQAGAEPPPSFVSGEILVKWSSRAASHEKTDARNGVRGQTVRAFHRIGWEHLRIDPTMDVQAAIRRLLQQPGVSTAEPNYIRHAAATTPNDPSFGLQWALYNVGQTVDQYAGTAGADIAATSAWDLRTTSPNVVVAILDTGISPGHPDLRENLWVNRAEIPGNGIDEDGNGYVDDVNGWNFVNDTSNLTDDYAPYFHGTMVAGIIGAKGNDGYGIAGVSWTVQLMSLKVLDSSGLATAADIVAAIQYAAAMRADIINASLGGYEFSQAEQDAIVAFPGLFVAAAGSHGIDTGTFPYYPACIPSPTVIAVAGTDQNDELAGWSNFGLTCVHLAAPGDRILSDAGAGDVGLLSGTSFAAPFVSGVAALLKAHEPNRTTADIRSAILANVDPKANLSGKVATGGRLNARAALGAIAPLPPSNPVALVGGPEQINLTWTDNSAGELGYTIQRRSGTGSFETVATLPADSTSYQDTSATGDPAAYAYRIQAFNSGAASEFSSEVGIGTIAAPSGGGGSSGAATGGSPVSSSSGGGGGGGGGCFVATAAFGSPMAAQVRLLKEFRDRYLLPHAPGRTLVAWYYSISPPLARLIAESEHLRALVRIGLLPLVGWAALFLWSPMIGLSIPVAAVALGVRLIREFRSR